MLGLVMNTDVAMILCKYNPSTNIHANTAVFVYSDITIIVSHKIDYNNNNNNKSNIKFYKNT